MPEKQKPIRTWKNPKTFIAAISLAGLLSLWNSFATVDRQRNGQPDPSASTPTATSELPSKSVCFTPIPAKNLGIKCASVAHTRSS
jgi:hypothetical protein